ncbi:MAG: hypothetical protein ACSW8C_01105 [bacterium]
MSIGVEVSKIDPGPSINPAQQSKIEILKKHFLDFKEFIQSKKQGLANIGQIAGTAMIVTGLITAGTPLGIPLLIIGTCLFAAGTAFQIMHHIEKTDMTVGEKIKGILKETLANLIFGSLTGVSISAISIAIPLKYLISIIGVIIKYKSCMAHNLLKEDGWTNFKNEFTQKSFIYRSIIDSVSFNDFIHKIMEKIKKSGSDAIETFNTSTAEILFEKIPNRAKEFFTGQVAQTALEAQLT